MQDNLKKIFGIENRTKYFTHVLIYLFLASAVLFGFIIASNPSADKKEEARREQKADPFREVSLQAKSAVVWDVVNKRELFAKNPDASLPLASLTKVVTAVTASENLSDDEKVVITPEDLEPEGDSNLVVGDVWNADDLRDFTLLTSSNDGALALAAVSEAKKHPYQGTYRTDSRGDFLDQMNYTASKIGLSSSRFFNEHGLDIEPQSGGAYGSAMDMAVLFEYMIKNRPDILEATRYKKLEFASAEKKYSAENTNLYIDKIPNVIASKTGYTDLAGGNLVVAFDAGLGRPIIISVLGSTEEGRFTDVLKLAEASLKYITN